MAVPPPAYKDYIPGSDSDFETWLIAFGPQYLASGLTDPPAVDIDAAATAYTSALAAAMSGATRGPATIQAKDVARSDAERLGRLGAQAMVQAYKTGTLTAEQLTAAGVRVPSDLSTPRNPPATGPEIGFRSSTVGATSVSIIDPTSSEFRKPIGCVGAEVQLGEFADDGMTPPTSFVLAGVATRKRFSVPTVGLEGKRLRVRARWLMARGSVSDFGQSLDFYGT